MVVVGDGGDVVGGGGGGEFDVRYTNKHFRLSKSLKIVFK